MTVVEPFSGKAVTRDYSERGLVALPVVEPAPPPLEECTREDLLDLAARAIHPTGGSRVLWNLLASSEYIAAIFRLLVESVEPEREEAVRLRESMRQTLFLSRDFDEVVLMKVDAARRAEADLRVLCTAELGERQRLAELHAQLSRENAEVRRENAMLRRELATALETTRIEAAFERVTITVTGESYRVVADRLTASVHAEQREFIDHMFEYRDAAGVTQPPIDIEPNEPNEHDKSEPAPHAIVDIDQSEPEPAPEASLLDPDDEITQDIPVAED